LRDGVSDSADQRRNSKLDDEAVLQAVCATPSAVGFVEAWFVISYNEMHERSVFDGLELGKLIQSRRASKKHIVWRVAVAFLGCQLQQLASAQSAAGISEAVRACQQVPGRGGRLSCYDRAFPPIVESAESDHSADERKEPVAAATDVEPPSLTTVQIIEVQMLSPGTTRFRAADGRTFVRADARTIHRWPEPPFDVEIQSGRFGTLFLKFPDSGLRIRVAVQN